MTEDNKKQSASEMEAEIKAAELELKQLEILEKKANLQDIKERLAERQMKRENVEQRARTQGQTLNQQEAGYKSAQARCNHRKGGNGAEGLISGQGDDDQYAIMKHQFCNGDIWVRCLRCGKTWKPPVERAFKVNGKLNQSALDKAWEIYNSALSFQTRNHMSGSLQYRFSSSDPTVNPNEVFRETMEHTNLR